MPVDAHAAALDSSRESLSPGMFCPYSALSLEIVSKEIHQRHLEEEHSGGRDGKIDIHDKGLLVSKTNLPCLIVVQAPHKRSLTFVHRSWSMHESRQSM